MTEIFPNVMTWIRLNWIPVLFFAVLLGAFIFLRTRASNIDDASELSAVLHDGKPTIIEFYSNF
jgi:hypothetical protein